MAGKSRILIVDDEEPIRKLVAALCERAGYVVRTAANGRDAIALCSEESFDLVLSDVRMPAMDGHELAQWIAEHRPTTRTALMSGFDATCQGCEYSPRCRLIAKPFSPQQVVSFVNEVLGA